MTNIETLESFYRMLLECYKINGWIFDRQLNMQKTNSISSYLHSILLLEEGRKEILQTHAQDGGMPLIVGDSMGIMWGCVFGKERVFAVGPIFTGNISSRMAENIVEPLNLSVQDKWALIKCIQDIPNVSVVIFFQLVIMLHYYITGEKIRVNNFTYHTPLPEHSLKKHKQELEEKSTMPHSPLINEKMLLDMVRTGNMDFQRALETAGQASPGIRTRSINPIRQAKYSVVAFTTLCSRAAIDGGLSSEIAYSLCDTYTESVEQCTTISQIAALSHTMYEDYIRRVNQCRRESGVTRPIRICCDYIDTHLMEELKLKELAEKSGYTEYYLTRKFKKEMGVSVNTYIRNARLRHAKVLLKTTQLSIQEISEELCFCSRSYFTEVFQKEEGVSPSEYREQK